MIAQQHAEQSSQGDIYHGDTFSIKIPPSIHIVETINYIRCIQNQEYNQNYTAGNSTVTANPNQGAVLTAWVSAQESTYPSTTANS